MSNDLLLPLAGLRQNGNGLPDGHGSYGFYRSSSPISPYAYRLFFYASSVSPQSYNYRASGLSVRCFKNFTDFTPPVITSISPTLENNKRTIKLTITAVDKGIGLDTVGGAYSFDNGATRQTGNQLSFSSNQIVFIKVRDAFGNVASASYTIHTIEGLCDTADIKI
jgi:hypothetical protein